MKNKNDTQKKEGKIYFELKLCFDAIRWILSPYLGDVNGLRSFLLRTSSSIKNIFKKHFFRLSFSVWEIIENNHSDYSSFLFTLGGGGRHFSKMLTMGGEYPSHHSHYTLVLPWMSALWKSPVIWQITNII